jgi:hypothetical protein
MPSIRTGLLVAGAIMLTLALTTVQMWIVLGPITP